MEVLTLAETVKQLPDLLLDADEQVEVVSAVLTKMLAKVGSYSIRDVKSSVDVLKRACHKRHHQLTKLALNVIHTFVSCSAHEMALAVLDYLPCLVSADPSHVVTKGGRTELPSVSTASNATDGNAEMKLVFTSLTSLISSSRTYLVPVLSTLYNLELDNNLSSQVFALALDALPIVDSGDIPAVIRTLLKSALDSSSGLRGNSGDLERVILAVRQCPLSLTVSEQVGLHAIDVHERTTLTFRCSHRLLCWKQ